MHEIVLSWFYFTHYHFPDYFINSYFQWVSVSTFYFWFSFMIITGIIIYTKKLSYKTKTQIIDLLFCIGTSLIVLYLLTGISSYVNSFSPIDQMEISIYQKENHLWLFRLYFVGRLCTFIFLIGICLFERFSLLPYIENRRQSKRGKSGGVIGEE
jgi:hypothetical protein